MRLSQICIAITQLARGGGAWSPLSLWPDGILSPGMWISPRDLTSEWQDYTGTTPVSVPGTVADSSNPVGLALDIRAGAPEVLGPELCTGTPSLGTGWTDNGNGTYTSDGNAGYIAWPGAVVGKMYQVSITCHTFSGTWLAGRLMDDWVPFASSVGTFTAKVVAISSVQFYSAGFAGIASFSCKEIPGNHMLQSTSAARPLMSARVNLITGSEDFTTGANWGAGETTLAAGFVEGGVTFSKFVETVADSNHDRFAKIGLLSGVHYIYSAKFKAGERSIATIRTWDATYTSDASNTTYFNLATQDIQLASNGVTTAGIVSEGNGIFRCWVGITPNHNTAVGSPAFGMSTSFGTWTYAGDGVSGLYVGGTQVEIADSLGVYQAISTAGAYSSTDFPIFQKYDGVDDGMATAAFTAGTLINGMDCMIAVRRDSAALVIAGLYETAGSGTRYTGYAESGASGLCFAGAGAPTVWVDDVQLSGGTSVTAGTLHTALTVGDWHILEFRNLDLSAWTAAAFGRYTGGIFNGPRGDILLYPSTAPTEDKDAARQWLADYYGVTLP